MFEDFGHWPELAGLRADLEAFHGQIKAEAAALMSEGKAFKPWHEPQIYEGEWDVYGLFWGGREVERRTMAPVSKEVLGAWQPLVFNAGFSLMRPGAIIKPHMGYTADVLRLHLGVVVPIEDPSVAGIRVGGQRKGWKEGECLLFDDTQEHEAWNAGDRARVVMLVDVLRPTGKEKGRRA
jgi:hypothetical protein